MYDFGEYSFWMLHLWQNEQNQYFEGGGGGRVQK